MHVLLVVNPVGSEKSCLTCEIEFYMGQSNYDDEHKPTDDCNHKIDLIVF